MTRLANGPEYQFRRADSNPLGQQIPTKIRHYRHEPALRYREPTFAAAKYNLAAIYDRLAEGREIGIRDDLWCQRFTWPTISVNGIDNQTMSAFLDLGANTIYFPPIPNANGIGTDIALPSIDITGRSAVYESSRSAQAFITSGKIVSAGPGIYAFGQGKDLKLENLVILSQGGIGLEMSDCHSCSLRDVHLRESTLGLYIHDSNQFNLQQVYARDNGTGIKLERVSGISGAGTAETNTINWHIIDEHDSWCHGHAEGGRNIMVRSRGNFFGNGMRFEMDDDSFLFRHGAEVIIPATYNPFGDLGANGTYTVTPGYFSVTNTTGTNWIDIGSNYAPGFYEAQLLVEGPCVPTLNDNGLVSDQQGCEGFRQVITLAGRHTVNCRIFVYTSANTPCSVKLLKFAKLVSP